MTRFYFHVRSPAGLEPDQFGLEFDSVDQAYFEAHRAIPKLAADLLQRGRDPMANGFEISDDRGRTVMEVPFSEVLNPRERQGPAQRNSRAGPRTRAGAALLAEQVYRSAFEGSPNAHLVMTPDLQIVGANAAFRSLTCSSPERLLNRYVFDAFPPKPNDPKANGAPNLTASFEQALRFATSRTLPGQRHDIRGRDGEWRISHWTPTSWPIRDGDGSIIALAQQIVRTV